MPDIALEIESGWELERFIPDTIIIDGRTWEGLTGFEGKGGCWWCGEELTGRHRKWCWGHGAEYYRHFGRQDARNWCCKRQDGICANCGVKRGWSLEVHHIVPLNGALRSLSAFNLPWNLIGFCHGCHQEVHAAMRPPKKSNMDRWELAGMTGQEIMPLGIN